MTDPRYSIDAFVHQYNVLLYPYFYPFYIKNDSRDKFCLSLYVASGEKMLLVFSLSGDKEEDVINSFRNIDIGEEFKTLFYE
jgi:hypothetical protein